MILAVSLAVLAVWPGAALAFYNRGTVQVVLGAASVSVPVGGTVTVSAMLAPSFYEGVIGCGLAQCPQECSGNCGDEVTGRCTCAGDATQRQDARAIVNVGNAFVAKASYASGSLLITGVSAGSTTITIQGTLWQHMDSAVQTIAVTVIEPVNLPPVFSAPPELPAMTPPGQETRPVPVVLPSLSPLPAAGNGGSSGGIPPAGNMPTLPPTEAPNPPSFPPNSPDNPGNPGGTPNSSGIIVQPSLPAFSVPSPTPGGAGQQNQALPPPMGGTIGVPSPRPTGTNGNTAATNNSSSDTSGAGTQPGGSFGTGDGTASGSVIEVRRLTAGEQAGEGNNGAAASQSQTGQNQKGEAQSNQKQDKEMNTMQGPAIVVTLTDQGPTGKAEMEQAKRENGRVIFQKLDSSNNVLYSWTFKGPDIVEPADIDMHIEFPEAFPGLEQEIGRLKTPLLLTFSHTGALPGKAEIYIRLDSRYASDEILTLYRVKDNGDEPSVAARDLPIKAGYVSFELERPQDKYALATGKTESMSQKAAIWASVGFLAVIAGFVITAVMISARKRRLLRASDAVEQAEEPKDD